MDCLVRKMGFNVIDNRTGKRPNLWDISNNEEWAKGLRFSDNRGFCLDEDGMLFVLDAAGAVAYCPEGRFDVVGA